MLHDYFSSRLSFGLGVISGTVVHQRVFIPLLYSSGKVSIHNVEKSCFHEILVLVPSKTIILLIKYNIKQGVDLISLVLSIPNNNTLCHFCRKLFLCCNLDFKGSHQLIVLPCMLKHDRLFLENVTIFLYDCIFQDCSDILKSDFF